MSEFHRKHVTSRKAKKDEKQHAKSVNDKLNNQNMAESDDDDDGSGGGPGKRMQGGFKLEKLLKVISDGRQKAKSFWKFLNKEGLDASDTQKSDLRKQTEKVEKDHDRSNDKEKLEKDTERAKEIQEEKQASDLDEKTLELRPEDLKDTPAWEKAKAVDAQKTQKFGLDKSALGQDGTRKQANSGTLFSKPEQTAGAMDANHAAQVSADQHGGRVQGAQHAKMQDYLGTMQFNHYGKDARQFALSKNTQVEKVASQKGNANKGQLPEQPESRQIARSAR